MADKRVVVDFEKKITVELSPEEYVQLQKLLRRRWYQRGWFWGFLFFMMFGQFIKQNEDRDRHFCNLVRATGHQIVFPNCPPIKP